MPDLPHSFGLHLPTQDFSQREERLRRRRMVAPASAPIFQCKLLLVLSHTLASRRASISDGIPMPSNR